MISGCRPVSLTTLNLRSCREGDRQKPFETLACLSLTSRVTLICFRYSVRAGEVMLTYTTPGGPVLYSSLYFAKAELSVGHSQAEEPVISVVTT